MRLRSKGNRVFQKKNEEEEEEEELSLDKGKKNSLKINWS